MPENTEHQKTPRTEAQKEASRINGSKSSGPTTLNGKDKSSRNALRHGLTAFELALSNEDAEAFNNVLADYNAEYLPEGPTETNLVEQIAFAQWRLYRSWTTETAIYNIEMDLNKERITKTYKHFAEPVRTADALETCLARTGSLAHIHRCQTRVNREYYRALNTLLALRKPAKSPRKQAAKTVEIAVSNPSVTLEIIEKNQSASKGETAEPDTQQTGAVTSVLLQLLLVLALLSLGAKTLTARPHQQAHQKVHRHPDAAVPVFLRSGVPDPFDTDPQSGQSADGVSTEPTGRPPKTLEDL